MDWKETHKPLRAVKGRNIHAVRVGTDGFVVSCSACGTVPASGWSCDVYDAVDCRSCLLALRDRETWLKHCPEVFFSADEFSALATRMLVDIQSFAAELVALGVDEGKLSLGWSDYELLLIGASESADVDVYGRAYVLDILREVMDWLRWEQSLFRSNGRPLVVGPSSADWLRNMPYADFLATDYWRDTRGKALAAAEFRCQVCFSDGPLDVHHRTYERRGCEKLSDLTVLCRFCHDLFHRHARFGPRGGFSVRHKVGSPHCVGAVSSGGVSAS